MVPAKVPALEGLTDLGQEDLNTASQTSVYGRLQYRTEEPTEVKLNSAEGRTGGVRWIELGRVKGGVREVTS